MNTTTDANNVFVINEDIVTANADVIVNAANGWGYMGGKNARNGTLDGISESLCYATNGEMETFCLVKARRFAHIPSFIFGKKKGDIFSSPSFGLNCSEVIHAVTVNSPGSRSDVDTIYFLVHRILNYCIYKGFHKIAMPLLGAGTGGLNKDDVHYIITERASIFPELLIYVYTK